MATDGTAPPSARLAGASLGYFPYPNPADDTARALVALSRALSLLQALNRAHNMTVEQAQVFLMVALVEGKTHSEYADMANLARPTVSRIMSDMSHYRRTRALEPPPGAEFGRGEGFGLLEQQVNPNEMRQRLVFLSPKGKALYRRLAAVLLAGGVGGA